MQASHCDGKSLRLGPGEHTIISTPGLATGVDLDLLVWESPGAGSDPTVLVPEPPTVEIVEIVEHSATEWSIVSQPCPDGCWLVFGQGYNEGWSATDHRSGDLGPSRPMAGGFNGWWLPPGNEPGQIAIRFAPQRRLDIALVISLLATLACLAVVVGSRIAERRRTASTPDSSQPDRATPEGVAYAADQGPHDDPSVDGARTDEWSPVPASRAADLTARRAAVAGSALVVVTAAFVGPVWVLPALVAGGLLVAIRRARLVGSAGVALLAIVMVAMVRRQILYGYEPGGAWPSNFADLHRLTMFAILLVGVACWGADHDRRPAIEPPAD